MRFNPRTGNQPLFAIKALRKLKPEHFKKNVAVPLLFVEGDNGCGIKFKDKAKLVGERPEKLLGITNGTNRIANILHQLMGLMDGRAAHDTRKYE
jgi:hypothetical protein